MSDFMRACAQLSWKCNLGTCPYCWVRRRIATDADFQQPDHPLDEWLPVLNAMEPTLWDITGGEPLMIPGFADFLNKLDKKHGYAITSNLVGDYVYDFIAGAPKENCLTFTASWHPTSQVPIAVFVGKLTMLRLNGFEPVVQIVDHESIRARIQEDTAAFKKVNFRVDVIPFYEIDDIAPIEKHRCLAGSRYFWFNNNGDVYRCGTWVAYSMRHLGGYLGNLFDGTFKPLVDKNWCDLRCTLTHEAGPLDNLPKYLEIENL